MKMQASEFRVYSKQDGWIELNIIDCCCGELFKCPKKNKTIIFETLSHYIGIKNKHDDKLYEGDIIDLMGVIGIIKYSVSSVGYVLEFEDKSQLPLGDINIIDCDIITNIYVCPNFFNDTKLRRNNAKKSVVQRWQIK